MKSLYIATLFLLVFGSQAGLTQHAATPSADEPASSDALTLGDNTPAQLSIAAARQQLKADPKKVQAYNELAIAYIKRVRETADPAYLNSAEAALAQGLKLDAQDFQLQRTQVALMLAQHKYVQARDRAGILNRRTPDDVMTYGYLADADIALGNYPDAETNAQWMLNMRANNIPGLLIGAKLRTLFGDARGAIEFLNLAYSETSPTEVEDLAWIANLIADVQIESGQIDAAAETLEQTEHVFPNYPYTVEHLAQVRMSQSRAKDAVELWKRAALIDHDPHTLYGLATAQEAAGQLQEAQATYARFTGLARDSGSTTNAARLDLILMYAGNPQTASEALKLANKEIAERQDVWTLDSYAWALYANARFSEADITIHKAIAVGIQSAQIFDHAGHIAQKLNHDADSMKYFSLSLQSNPSSLYAADARKHGNAGTLSQERKDPPQTQPVVKPLETASPKELLATADQRTTNPASPHTGMAAITPVFTPVPEALLVPQPTGTEHAIHAAQAAVTRAPKDAMAYAALGAAYFQHARETGDVSDYQLAEQSLNESLNLVSADFSADAALGTMAEVCMGEHRFADALTYARKALSLGTGDISPFAIVGDAYADMGEYDKAAAAYGRLTPRDMTLSPRAAYARDSRLSYLRFVMGDTAGAISLMDAAVAEGLEAKLPGENLAWLYYELGEYHTQAGDAVSADSAYRTALTIHPGDYRALAALAKLRANHGRYAEAIVLYQKAIAVVPMPTYITELGDLYSKSGNQAEARKQYELVEYIGLLGHINQVLHNRDLALFYADHDMKLNQALDLARKELEVRHDVYTWDALAWALYKNGNLNEAATASEKALQYGTRDSLLLFHAGMIAWRKGEQEQARNNLNQALQINSHFHLLYADAAQKQLTLLARQTGSQESQVHHAR